MNYEKNSIPFNLVKKGSLEFYCLGWFLAKVQLFPTKLKMAIIIDSARAFFWMLLVGETLCIFSKL